jgi:UDP-glucose 4-epimerase
VREIERLLGWRPQVPLEEGVRLTLAEIHHWRDAPVWEPGSIAAATADWFRYLGR